VPIVVRKGIGRKNASGESGTYKKLPRLEAEARWLKEDISPSAGEPAPGRKILSAWQVWKAMRKTRIDWASFYWAPRSLWSK
jgi:hypothetical protein